MHFHASRHDAARQRRAPGTAGHVVGRARPPQRADRRDVSPPPPPPPPPRRHPTPPRHRHPPPPPRRPPTLHPRDRGVGDARRGAGPAEREAAALGAPAAAARRGNAADVAGDLLGDAPASVVAREEETGGGGEAGSKRRSPLASSHPPPLPKRRAVSATRHFPPGCGRHPAASLARAEAGSQRGDAAGRGRSGVLKKAAAAAPLPSGMDGALLGAMSPRAAGTTALKKKVSATDADGPMADCGHHAPGAGTVKYSSEALRRSGVAVADHSLDSASRGVHAVLVEGRENRAGSGESGRKELVPAAPMQAEPMMSFSERSFPPGCGKDAVLSVLVGGGNGEERLPMESSLADGDLGVAEEVVFRDGCIPTVHEHDMENVLPQRNGTIDGTVQDDELEEGEIPPEVVVQGSQVSASGTLLDYSASRHGASAEISAAETSAMQSSNEKTGGNTLQCGEKRSSCLVVKEVELMNESIGSSCNGVTESLAEDSSKQNMMCNRVSESARMNIASSVMSGDIPTVTSVTLYDPTGRRHGASVPEFSAVETSAMQPSNEISGGNTLQCGDKRSSGLVAKDVEEMNKYIGTPSKIVAESLAEDSSKQDMMDRRVFESARMNRTPSDVAGVSAGGGGTKMRSKAMFTPRKQVKPAKMIKISAVDTHNRLPEDKEKENEHGRHVIIDRIKDTNDLSTDRAMHAPASSDKCPMTLEKEAAISRGFFGPRKKVKVKVPAHVSMKIGSTSALGSYGKLNDEVASNLDDDDILKALVVHEGKLELYLNNSSGLSSVSGQRKYGSQNAADARSKFKMSCRRFEFVCRALVQAVEQHSLKIRRIDLEADKVIRNLPDFTKHGPIVGEVPGVEVGDEFLYRVQLAIVGLHRVYQGGIDTTKYRNGERIAISIVASGGYPDELPCSGELIYTGSGGKASRKKGGEDQKLERGNLALKNCIKTKTPVRVIHGFKDQNTEGGSHSRAKQISTFTYDGLYRVVDFWMDGRPGSRVFKYKLQKIPGQPELPMHIAKGMRKSKTRPGLCMVDLSQGKEGTPICVINTVDDVRPTQFRYITRIKYPTEITKIRHQHQGCDCTNGCSDSVSCSCAVKNGGEIPFNMNGAIVNEKPLILECGPSCKCPPSCQNRVSQHAMKIPLEVFRTKKTGWGVRSLRSISSGSFICEYVGELLDGKDADKRRNRDYLFDIGLNCGDENLCNGSLSTLSGLNSSSTCSQTMGDVGFTIDAAEYGNIGRFINHSCSPNLYTQNVLWDHDDKRMPHIMFFAAEMIPPLQELTYDYNYEIDHVQDVNGRIKFKVCQCGSPQCSGRLY